MPLKEALGRLAYFWKAYRVLESRLEAKPSRLVLNADETPELRLEESERTGITTVIHDHVGKSASRHVGTSARRHVGTSPSAKCQVPSRHVGTSPSAKSASRHVGSGRHPARERSSAMIELVSPGQRCLPRTTTGDQHTPRADYRHFGADSLGGGELSLG